MCRSYEPPSTTSSTTTDGPAPSSTGCARSCGSKPLVLQPVNLNDVVREVVDLAHSEIIARGVTVTSTLAPGTPFVLGDRVQLQQVVLNLLLNACDAMSETPLSQRRLALTTAVEDGFVHLAVADRGTGIPKNRLDHVFEPFVTFRERGSRPRACDQPLDRDRPQRLDSGRKQRRRRRDFPVLFAARRDVSDRANAPSAVRLHRQRCATTVRLDIAPYGRPHENQPGYGPKSTVVIWPTTTSAFCPPSVNATSVVASSNGSSASQVSATV